MPLTTITNNPIPNERMGNATSIFNLMRNIGASIGISMVETVQFRKEQVHINNLGANIYPQNPQAQQMMNSMKGYFMSQGSSAATATQQAYESMWGMVAAPGRHALVQRYVSVPGDNVCADDSVIISAAQAEARQVRRHDSLIVAVIFRSVALGSREAI